VNVARFRAVTKQSQQPEVEVHASHPTNRDGEEREHHSLHAPVRINAIPRVLLRCHASRLHEEDATVHRADRPIGARGHGNLSLNQWTTGGRVDVSRWFRRATWLVGAALVVSSWFVERYALRVALTGTGFPLVWAAGFMYRRQRRALRQPSHPE